MASRAPDPGKVCWVGAVALVALSFFSATLQAQTQAPPAPTEQVTFFYYDDVDAAARFYETLLGLEKTHDEGWVKFYAVTETASVGLVDAARGYHRSSPDKPVMLSLVTDDVESWFEHVLREGASILKPLDAEDAGGFIRAFLVEDPGGYTVEVFEWR
jgi:predicted enzyme related to lactoylglutathione lyase